MVRRQVVRAVLACTRSMAVLELLLAAVFPLQTLLLLAVPVARDLARQPGHLAARPALQALLVPHLLPVGCLGKAAVVVAVALLARAVQAVQVVAALAAVAVAQHAVHTLLVLVV